MTNLDPMILGYAVIIITVGLNIYTQAVNVRKPIEKLNTSSEVITTKIDAISKDIDAINRVHRDDKIEIKKEIERLETEVNDLKARVSKLEK